jgi:Asp-tRNA(Asn)/Glu-tRNA(Gln) amidotransferase C subunit
LIGGTMEQDKILKLLEEVLELDNETLYDKENYSIFQMVERLQEDK